MPPAPLEGDPPLLLSAEVAEALRDARPVVALESTIIAHGLPRPRNLEVAAALEDTLRVASVTPATVAVLDGAARVGLDAGQLERIATGKAVKASVRDLPVALSAGRDAATTVSATALLAHRAGIRVFATGGLGGVHRAAASTFDESADLHALSRTPLLVVCAGVKSILDVPATLERLETLGVTVVGYRTDRFPGFYVTDSGAPVDWRVDAPDRAAAVLHAAERLRLPGAVVIANPLPAAQQLDPATHHRVLQEALAAAEAADLHGKDVTPFLLDHIQHATGGDSLEANVHAVTGNVALAAAISAADARGREASRGVP